MATTIKNSTPISVLGKVIDSNNHTMANLKVVNCDVDKEIQKYCENYKTDLSHKDK